MFRLTFAISCVLFPLLLTEAFAQFLKDGEYYLKVETAKVKTSDGATITLTKGDRLLVTPVVADHQYILAGLGGREITIDHEHLISPAEAIDFFNRAIREKPTARNYLARGKTYFYARGRDKPPEIEKALADINQAVRLEPKFAEAYLWRAETNWSDPDQAIADYTKAIELDPKFAMAYFRRASRHDREMEPDKFIGDYINAIRLDPTWPEAWWFYLRGRSDIYSWAEEDPQVEMRAVNVELAYFDNEIKRNPDLLTQSIKYRGNETKPLAPHILGLYIRRGKLMEYGAKYENAIADYSKFIEMEAKSRPRSPTELGETYRRRAWILATCPNDKIRDGDKAVRDATMSNELTDKKNAKTLATLAAAYAEKGEFDKAVEWQQEVVKVTNKSNGEERLAYYRDKKPYREQAGEDLTQYGQIPKDLHTKTPQHVLQQFYDYLAAGKVENAAYLVLPDREKRFHENLIKSLDYVVKGKFGFEFKVLMTEQDEDATRSLAIVKFTHTKKKADDPKRIQYQGVFLQKRIVGWMISPTFRLPFGTDSLSDESDPLHKWYNEQRAKLSGR